MKKLIKFYQDHSILITIISLVLLVAGMTIVGCCELDPWWYVVPVVLGLPVLLLFLYVIIAFLIVVPIKKLINRNK